MRAVSSNPFLRLAQAQAARHGLTVELTGDTAAQYRRPLWMKLTSCVMVGVMYLAPAVFLADEVAHAAPIVDPRAPVPFQPTVTQSAGGVPVIGIAAPNAQGLSANQFQSLSAGPEGLIFNNSLTAGTSLIGGAVGANPNLAGRTASTILAQVTSTGAQYASVLAGPLEVFGAPAALVIANPNGISVPGGTALTNISALTLTTGVPQFLTGVGGTPTDYAHAGALAYDVQSGHIQIEGAPGVNGPGPGIDGTVGNIDLIAQTIGLNAPLRADQRVNVIAGNQLVNPATTDATGTTYGTAANGSANTVTAISTPNGLAIDASQFGSVTSGQIFIVATAAGMGVNLLGALGATAGNVVVNANGDITAGTTYASQNVNLTSSGNTSIAGTGLANENYTVAANGDINATGSVSAGQDVAFNAGGDLSAASVAASGSANLIAGGSMTLGSLSANSLNLQATNGNLTLGQSITAPGAITAIAGQNLTVNGAVQGGSTVTLTGGQNATVNGSVSGVGDVSLAAQAGSAAVSGNVQTDGALSVTAGQNVALGGTAQAQGPVTITAQNGSITGQGDVASSQGAVSLDAGQNIQSGGALQAGTTLTTTSGGNTSLSGAVSAPGAVSITTGGDASLGGNVISGSMLTVAAGGSATVQGSAASVGSMSLSAASGTLSTTGNVVTLGALGASGQQGVSLGGTVSSQGNATIASTDGSVAVSGALSTPGQIAITAGQDATVAGTVHSGQSTTLTAGQDVNLNGGLEVDGTGNATVNAGRDLTGSGAVSVANDTTLTAGRNLSMTGAIQTGNNLGATAAQDLSVGATTAVGTETLTATSGSATLAGNALSGGNLAVTAGTDVSAQGSVQSLGNLALNAQGGNLSATGPISTAGATTLNAGQNLTLAGQTIVSGDATLTGTNITTQGLAVGGNLVASATNSLDTSAGQLNAAFDANAPALSVSGNATLTGANVTTANAAIGGTYSATGTSSLTTGGTAAYQGDATLAGGTVTNVGQQMAAGNLSVSGSTVTNQGALSSLQTVTINAGDLDNSGSIYGPTANLNVSNSTVNTGALLATNALTLTTASLDDSNGLIFAGDVNNPASPVGDVTVNVSGGGGGTFGSFTNTNGQILAQNSLTVNLPNQTIDPSAAVMGNLNGGAAFNLSVLAISNSGAWTLPGTAVSVSASQGITNAGTISQGAGTLALNGDVSNTGTITANDLTINGSLANQAGATVQANDAFTLTGTGGTGVNTNAGTVEAVNTLNIAGVSYDNSNGITQAGNSSSAAGSGNLNINLTGDLGNAGGTLTATNDLGIVANNVNNSAASTSTTTTTTTTVINSPLLMSTVIGTETSYYVADIGADGGYLTLESSTGAATLGDLLSPTGESTTASPVADSGSVQFVQIPTPVSYSDSGQAATQNLWFVQDGSLPAAFNGPAYVTQTLTVPSVTETTTSTQASAGSSVIAAGHNVSITASSLNNQSGTISAGNDANVNVQSLNNGGSTYSSTVTDTVDTASLDAFINALQSLQTSGGISVYGSGNASGTYNCTNGGGDNGQFCAVGPVTPPTSFSINAPGSITTQATSSSVTVQGPTGQIVAGHNLNLSGGDLVNAGSLAAGNDVNITASSFTNQGTNAGTMTTTAGCAAGFSAGCSSLSTTNPNSQTYSYQQINSTVTAGHDIVIAANTVSNTYGTLAAANNVIIGGAGTTASSPTQAVSVTNTSGAIAAGNDVDINAASIINTVAAPVQVHQNYGSATPFTGCTSNCEAYVDVQSAAPATITANHDVNLQAVNFSNTGSLVTAMNNVTINASSSATSDNQYLNAYWSSGFTRYGTGYATWGCANDPSLCGTLYGSAYSSSAPQDPAGLPSSVGLPDFVPATIQAGNTLSVNSPTLTNTGNVIGQTVNLTGSQLVNGLTNPNVYTPPPAISGQVITLGPPAVPGSATTTINGAGLVTTLGGQPTSVTGAAGLPSNTPIGVQTVGKPVAPTVGQASTPAGVSVQTIAGQTVSISYLVNSPASQVMGDLTPAALLAKLPTSLQPDTTQFYYDPFTEDQQIEQAALQATGNASFYSTTSATDSTSQTAIENQDKAALYGAALQYAEQNNIALGTQLSAAQLALVNTPMLWYVEETVPEPGCTATGNGACPTVQALMPEVLLPQNYAAVSADGEISGTNVTLDYANSILNTGSISAQNLTVDTASLTNETRSTNIGTIYNQVDAGVEVTTGTVVQQGGFMSAMNYDMNAQAIDNIGGAIQQVNADGSVNQAATAELLSNLKSQLGGNFTQSTVSNDLNTTLIADNTGIDPMEIVGMVAAVVISVYAGPEVLAAYESALGAGALATGLAVGTTAFAASAASQFIGTGSVNWKSAFETAAVSGLTAGLGQALLGTTGISNLGNGITQGTPSLTLANLPQTALNIGEQSLIGAGVQTMIEGGSFGNALLANVVDDVAAVGNNAIGMSTDPLSLANIAEHAALGCASGAALGSGCSSSALGGAVGAIASGALVDATGGSDNLTNGQRAAIVGASTLAGGVAADLLGLNGTAAASAAQSEALNNGTSKKSGFNPNPSQEPGMTVDIENDTIPIVPQGAPLDEEQAGNTMTVGQGTPLAAGMPATNSGGLTAGDQIGMLRDAATGKGNFALGEASTADANVLGQDWVGPGYRVSQTDGSTLISADGLRQYRPPSPKPNSSYATTGVQANFQSRSVPSGAWQNNGHLNITGP